MNSGDEWFYFALVQQYFQPLLCGMQTEFSCLAESGQQWDGTPLLLSDSNTFEQAAEMLQSDLEGVIDFPSNSEAAFPPLTLQY